ncbi:MAG: carboxypeptidase-like regulatory domain-containing protein [Thermoplasmatota archaeon]
MRTPWIALLLVTVALAGCSDGGGGGGDELEDPALGNIDVTATSTTGVIRGVVVDAAIRPITGATVSVPLPGGADALTSETDESGAFGFEGLEPGTYFVKVTKLGYFDQQQSVDVVAGVNEPPAVKVLLEVNVETTPFYEEYTFNGFVECGHPNVAVCGVVDLVANLTLGGPITNDNFLVRYPLGQVPSMVQSEMVWQSTQALGGQFSLIHSWNGDCTLLCDDEVTGGSPLLLISNETTIAEATWGAGEDLIVRTFSGPAGEPVACVPATPPATSSEFCPTNSVGLAVQQEFTIFTHVFYGYTPPEGWRFTEGGSPPAPEG